MARVYLTILSFALVALPGATGAAGRSDYPHDFTFLNDGDVVVMTVEGNGMDGNGGVHFPTLAGVPPWGSGADLVKKFGPLNQAENNWPK